MQARLGRAYLVWSRFASNRLAVVGLGIIIALLLVAAFADVLAPHSPVIGDLRNARLLPPGGEYLLGTDDQGRDILSRLIYGSRLTLYVVILVAIIAAPIGLLVGTDRRLCRRLGQFRPDAHHRHLPGVSRSLFWHSPSSLRSDPASRMRSLPSRSPRGRPMRASPAPKR